MILLEKVKDLKIYRTQMFLPTLKDDKKKQSMIMLLSPNYNASKNLINSKLFVNKLRYSSYYLEKNLSYFINDKKLEEEDNNPDEIKEAYEYLEESMKASKRNSLPDSAFGVPDKRKFPLDTEARVRSAIKFFNYVDSEDEAGLARRIKSAMAKYGIKDVQVSDKNRFSKYYKSEKKSVKEDVDSANMVQTEPIDPNISFTTVATDPICPYCGKRKEYLVAAELNGKTLVICQDCMDDMKKDNISIDYLKANMSEENYIMDVDNSRVFIMNEDTKYDNKLKQMLYKNRLKRRNDVEAIYDIVKMDCPDIKNTFYDLGRYAKKNIYVDLYFYNNSFISTNTWTQMKGFNLYYDFMGRLLNDSKYKVAGYKYKTIFIPIVDWDRFHDGTVWDFKKNVNPISIIYYSLFKEDLRKLTTLFGNTDIIFVGNTEFFKINFSALNIKNCKSYAVKFRNFVTKICANQDFDPEDIDTSADNVDSTEVTRTKFLDKLDVNKGIDLTKQVAAIDKDKKTYDKQYMTSKPVPPKDTRRSLEVPIKNDIEDEIKDIDKATLNKPDTIEKIKQTDANKMELATKIDMASTNAASEDDILDDLDDDEKAEFLKLVQDIQSNEVDSVNISAGRASRITSLDQKMMDINVNGKTIKDILDEKPEAELPVAPVKVSTPNEEWNDMTYVNFDKDYNLQKDIISIFKHFATTSRPIAVKNLEVIDSSTSEDRINTYKVEVEDYTGKRFTIKLDIPIMVDNRFLLRGNYKSIQTQFYNMPIIKTENDTCQIISNYMKIFVRRYGETNGRTMPLVAKFIKAANKYTGNNLKFTFGDRHKVCAKYELPIDYIALSSYIAKIETSDFIIYFDQDELYSTYEINNNDSSKLFAYGYNKITKEIMYMENKPDLVFVNELIKLFEAESFRNKYKGFVELIDKAAPPTSCAFSRCSIMSSQIPLVVICAYHEGLRKTLEKANIKYKIVDKLLSDDRANRYVDWIRFKDGYIVYECNYESSLLMNGLKVCSTELFELENIDNKNMYLEFLDDFGGRIKADGLDNFYDLMMDPITVETLKFYHLPTDYVSVLLYANALLADNKFIKHTDTSSRRLRRYELISAYTYKVLSDAYAEYANQAKHSMKSPEFHLKQSAVIDRFLTDTITSDDSCINALRDLETTNAITTKGPSGMNSDRAYSLDKRTYDSSMLNVCGMSTGFSANVGITRQATMNANVTGERGYVKSINGDLKKMNSANTLSATEALTPFGTTRDDPTRTAMTFIQTAKHMVRTEQSDPLLVTSGSDEALPYLTTDKFAFKAKKDGFVKELTEEYMILEYKDGTHDYINLKETIEKNSDGGYFVPLKRDAAESLKVNSKVKANQIVAYDKLSFSNVLGESDNIAYNIGKLAKVAVINSDEGFEDSGIITETFAEKMSTPICLQYSGVIDKECTVVDIKKIGDHVEVGDTLIAWQSAYEDEDTNDLLRNLSSDEISELGKRTIKTEVTGRIVDIRIFRTVEVSELSDSLKKIVNAYEKPHIELEKKLKAYKQDISQIPSHTILPATGKLKKSQEAIYIEFYVEFRDTVGRGDKLVNYSANKCVEKKVIPAELYPYTMSRPEEEVSAFVSEVSIDKRMVSSTIIIGSINKIMVEMDRQVKDIMGIKHEIPRVI